MKYLSVLSLALLAACGGIPQDPDGTLDRVTRAHEMKVGIVEGGAAEGIGLSTALLAAVAKETGARPIIAKGPLEALLIDLEAGRLDLVLGGQFAQDTPWKTRVTLGPPLVTRISGTEVFSQHAVTRNGENAWIVLIQRQAKALAPQ